MKDYNAFFSQNSLFQGISAEDFSKLTHCLNGKHLLFKKNEYLIRTGTEIRFIGIVLSGSVQIVREDINGNPAIIGRLGAGELFAEVFVCAGITQSPVSVQADQNCEVYTVSAKKLTELCAERCIFHNQLVKNLLKITAQKALELSQKLAVISKRTTREKIMLFLEQKQAKNGSAVFTIPFDRQALADYLCVERSALSRELGVMQRDGLISFTKNKFTINGAN